MAITATLKKEVNIGSNNAAKLYELSHDNSATSVAVTPGAGYTIPWGAYLKYTNSSGVFTMTVTAQASAKLSHILFLKP